MKKIALLMSFAAFSLFAGENEIPQHRLPTPDRFEFPATEREIDVYMIGRYDFDGDGTCEQIIITSGCGSGGPVWYIARLNGEKLSEEIQGFPAMLKSKAPTGFPDLRVERKCGADERHFELYRFNGEKYECIRREIHDYGRRTVRIEKTDAQDKKEETSPKRQVLPNRSGG